MTLSPREREIVILIGRDGLSDKRIALELGIGYWTVREYIKRIMARYPTKKRPRAACCDLYYHVHYKIGEFGDTINSD